MYYDYEKFFRKRLAELRTAKDVSARDMSLSLGQSNSYINKIENGKMMPSMTVFFYICDYLNIHPKDFFDESNSQPEIIRKVEEKLIELSDEQLTAFYEFIKDLP